MSNSHINVVYDVVVVGGGLSGLVAVYNILQRDLNLNFLIVEKETYCGGQIYSNYNSVNDNRWFDADQNHMINLCNELNVKFVELDKKAKHLKSIWDIDKHIGSLLARFELHRFLRHIDLLSQTFQRKSELFALTNGTSIETYICKNLIFHSSRNIVRFIVRAMCGVETDEITLSNYLNICYGTNGISNQLNNLTGYSKQFEVVPNLMTLVNVLEDSIGDDHFLFETKIIKIEQSANFAVLLTDSGKKIQTLMVILAIRWKDIREMCFYPEIPKHVRLNYQMMARSKYVTNFVTQFDLPYWRLNGYSGFILSHQPHFVCYESKRNQLSGLIYHNEGEHIMCKTYVLQKLCTEFGHLAEMPINYCEKTYEQSPIINVRPLEKWNCMVWASTDFGFCCTGRLNSAVEMGRKAAISTLLTLRPQIVERKDIDFLNSFYKLKPSIGFAEKIVSSINLSDLIHCSFIISMLIGGTFIFQKNQIIKNLCKKFS